MGTLPAERQYTWNAHYKVAGGKMGDPTKATYAALQAAWRHFNRVLFKGARYRRVW
jgi:hypothetical protein